MGNIATSSSATCSECRSEPCICHNPPTTGGAKQSKDQICPPFSKKERDLIHRYLPDFTDLEGLSSRHDQALIADHWTRLFPQENKSNSNQNSKDSTANPSASSNTGGSISPSPVVQLFDNFYRFLFEIAPQTKPLFRSSMQVQGKALIQIVGAIKNMLTQPDMVSRCSGLARRHVTYGVKPEYFNALGLALLKTLQKCSESANLEWNMDIAMAWRRVFVHVGLLVIARLHQELYGNQYFSVLKIKETNFNSVLPKDAVCPMSGNKLSDVQGSGRGQCPFWKAPFMGFFQPRSVKSSVF